VNRKSGERPWSPFWRAQGRDRVPDRRGDLRHRPSEGGRRVLFCARRAYLSRGSREADGGDIELRNGNEIFELLTHVNQPWNHAIVQLRSLNNLIVRRLPLGHGQHGTRPAAVWKVRRKR
jgi:hypothetical protein